MMDFRVRQLQCFLTLSECLNYGKTARTLYMSQPTITFQIQSLEDAFGVKLFERDRKRVRLTAAGEVMRTYVQNIMNTIGDAREHMKTLHAPRQLKITCGAPGLLGLLPSVLRSLGKHHPAFELEVAELTTEEQMEQLAERKIDAIMMMPSLPIAGATFVPLCSVPLMAVVSRQNVLASRTRISVRDLQGANVLSSRAEDCRFSNSFLAGLLSPFGVEANLVEVPQACSVQLAYAAAGAGVLITPYSAGYDNLPDVVALPFVEHLPLIELGYMKLADDKREALALFEQVLIHCAARTDGAHPRPKKIVAEHVVLEFPRLKNAV